MRLVDQILTASREERYNIYSKLNPDEKASLNMLLEAEQNNPWARYETDPVGFINEGLGETLWSKQIEIADSVVKNQRTAVAACHAPGKSHLSA